ncbi:phosphate system positive regulatory protein pho81 [Rhizophlyctis rosea]|nr:phosphate system positive regulatory protein pho81 [Rhizophlyctis rosea]
MPFYLFSGHAFLDKKFYVQINFSSLSSKDSSPIRLFGSRQLSSLKLLISSKPEVGVPYSVILPLQDDQEVYTFLVDDLSQFSLQFDIFPTFGTKPIGRAVALPSQLEMAVQKSWSGAGLREPFICPLFDPHLRVVGELGFEFAVVKPFIHPSLQIGGKVETYWKSHKVVNTSKGHTESGIHSFITASSLAEEYVEVVVQLTKDGVAAVFPDWFLPIQDLSVAISQVPFGRAQGIFAREGGMQNGDVGPVPYGGLASALRKGARLSCDELASIVYSSLYSLEEVLTSLPAGVGVSIVLQYPTATERAALELCELPDLNTLVDTVLQNVYDHANQRSIIFSSFNPSVCTAINWKQPNYGVFFRSRCGFGTLGGEGRNTRGVVEADARCNSIKEAIHFAKSSNVLGVICEATPLVQVPVLISTIKESGLMLATFGSANEDPQNVKVQEGFGVDGIIANNVFRYNVT